MKEQQSKVKLTIDELKIESFVTSINNEMNMRLSGGFASEHPTHTEVTDVEHHECTTVVC